MNTASLELCEELYEASGWWETEYTWVEMLEQSAVLHTVLQGRHIREAEETYPAYDLGFLLEKLPQNTWVGYVDTSGKRGYALAKTYAWNAEGNDIDKIAECRADAPEDAACRLAIELFRQAVLKRE